MSGMAVLEALAARLLDASLVGGALALLAWALCRFVPALPPALRCWLWWGVGLKMLAALLPLPALEVPLLPGRVEVAEVAAAGQLGASGTQVEPHRMPVLASTDRPAARPSRPFSWAPALVALWLAGVAVALARGGADLLRARRVVRAATAATDPALLAAFDALRRRLGVPRAELRLSSEVATPQAVGIQRPVVLLPAAMADRLSAEELIMAMGHELLHVRRGDLLLGLVPALAARCLFFHPLARLVEREYALAREVACDAAVVASLAPSPRAYGRLLLELALGCGAPLRAAAAAVTHPTLQRRLQMLLHPARPFRPALAWSLLLLGLGLLVPLRLTARDALAGSAPGTSMAPRAAAKEMPRPGEDAPPIRRSSSSFIYFRGGGEHTMDGSREDLVHARHFQRDDQPMIWVRRDGEEWVIDDRELLARVDALWAPTRRFGAQQAELGSRQAALGAQQAELGAHQAELGQRQAELAARQAEHGAHMARLAVELAQLGLREHEAGEGERADLESKRRELDSKREDLDRKREDLDRRREELSRRQEELGSQQEALGERQAALGDKQGALGDQQGALGGQQQRAAEQAQRQLEALLDEAIRSGQARRVD